MRLATLSQAKAYKGIRLLNAPAPRLGMKRCLSQVTPLISALHQPTVTEAAVWTGIRREEFRLPVQDFFWRILQGALRCGSFWDNISGYESRAECTACRCTDSPEHILAHCTAPGQRDVWRLTRNVWDRTGLPWPDISLGVLLHAGIWEWKATKSSGNTAGATRLWRILISESTYLIWKLRCERVIGHADESDWRHTTKEIEARWVIAINHHLALDCAMSRPRPPQSTIPVEMVRRTWDTVIDKPRECPHDWHLKRWVLVGISPTAPSGEGG